MDKFKVGDWVYGSDWCYGQITNIDEVTQLYYVEYDTGFGGGTATFLAEDLKYARHPLVTHFQQIKSFTLDEMAEFLAEHTTCGCCSRSGFELCEGVSDCKTHIKEWLMSEV